jgi:hypothetical protein
LTDGTVGTGLIEDSVSAAGVATGFVDTGGNVRRGIVGVVIGAEAVGTGVGLTRTGIEGEGRVRGVVETAGAGVDDAGGALVAAAVADGLGLGRELGDGRVLGEAEATGLDAGEVASAAAGVGLALGGTAAGVVVAAAVGDELGRGRTLADGRVLGEAEATGLGIAELVDVVAGVGVAV